MKYGLITVNGLKFLFLYSDKMLVFRAGIHKMEVRIANREDPDQTASDLGLLYLSRLFWQATSVRNFRIFTVHKMNIIVKYYGNLFSLMKLDDFCFLH